MSVRTVMGGTDLYSEPALASEIQTNIVSWEPLTLLLTLSGDDQYCSVHQIIS